jgi:4-amino-4-deoxy-L-arabinose transferase-like glycosyltransferase
MSNARTRRKRQRQNARANRPRPAVSTISRPAISPNGHARPVPAVAAPPDIASHPPESLWPVVAVFAVFLASLLVIPWLVDAPVGDDWVYTRSVEILVNDGRMHILDLSVVTLVFQVVWGALFSLVDVSFASTRASTIAIVLLSGGAMYALCRDMGVSRHRSALGAAVYLFNPLTFGLAFTFMTDPHFTALLVIAMWLYIRGLRPECVSPRVIILASAVASLTFLVRQQGLLIPFAVGLYLLLAGRWRPNLVGIRTAAQVAGLPALTMVAYYAWLLLSHGAPEQQSEFLSQMTEAGVYESRILISRMTYIEIAYLGFFLLPITLAAVPRLRTLRLPSTRGGRLFLGLWVVIAIAGYLVFAGRDKYMPYIAQYAGFQGIGPTDLQGGRPGVIDGDLRRAFTWIFLASTVLFALALSRRLFARDVPGRASASLLAMIGIWQVVGVLPPSFHFRNWIISVDRYLLPLLPIAIALLLWSLRETRLWLPLGWLAVTVYAAFSIAGTRDLLVFQDATWEMAHEAIATGVPITALDGGASWDGYYLYEYSIANNIDQQTPHGPWWTDLFGPATTSMYVVSTRELPGYEVVREDSYSSWLDGESRPMYLLRKNNTSNIP